jgi:hypothetical protein
MLPSIQTQLRVSNKKEELILKYLELTYGNREVYEGEKSIGINGICIYYKNIKQVGVPGKVHNDLVNWFGPDRYQKIVEKWFSKKYNLEVI